MPKLRINLSVVIDTDLVDINAGNIFSDVNNMTSDDWTDACKQYIDMYPEEVLEMFQETDLMEQITDNATVEYVSAT